MLGYSGVEIALSSSVRFISDADIDGTELEIFSRLVESSFCVSYVNAADLLGCSVNKFVNIFANSISLENSPYSHREWLAFSDDLATLSHRAAGLIIIIDDAKSIISADSINTFSLIESFLVQVHHWQKKGKPCYLCFQLDSKANIAGWAVSRASGQL